MQHKSEPQGAFRARLQVMKQDGLLLSQEMMRSSLEIVKRQQVEKNAPFDGALDKCS